MSAARMPSVSSLAIEVNVTSPHRRDILCVRPLFVCCVYPTKTDLLQPRVCQMGRWLLARWSDTIASGFHEGTSKCNRKKKEKKEKKTSDLDKNMPRTK
jgi:hypothetical protein